METCKRVQAQLQKELNESGSGRGEWHVAHSCVPKQQYLQLEKELQETYPHSKCMDLEEKLKKGQEENERLKVGLNYYVTECEANYHTPCNCLIAREALKLLEE